MNDVNKLTIPSYPLILVGDDVGYIKVFAKMYQLYHSLDKVTIVEPIYYKNYTIGIIENKESIVFSWLEFVLFEIVDFINNIHTETEGIYKKVVSSEDLLRRMDFEMLWENIEDWCADLTIEDFDKLEDSNTLIYIFKMFKCTEHYINKNNKMVSFHSVNLDTLKKDINNYYSTNIDKNISTETKTIIPDEINTGVIPGTTLPALSITTFKKTPAENEIIIEEGEKEEENDKIKVELASIKNTTNGIYYGI